MATDLIKKFEILKTHYKEVKGHKINVYTCIPRDLRPGKYPLIIRFHGGALVTGSALYPGFFAQWLKAYALQQKAIIVCPEYRLLPESDGLDILSDISDFWSWLGNPVTRQSFNFYLRRNSTAHTTNVSADLTRVLVTGESAGGYCAVQSVLSRPKQSIHALMVQYPELDVGDPASSTKTDKSIFNIPVLPADTIDVHLKGVKNGEIVTSAEPPARVPLVVSMIQQGRLLELLGKSPDLFPLDRLVSESHKGLSFPPTFVFHGEVDHVIDVNGSGKFVDILKGLEGGEEKVVYHVEKEADHGFDGTLELDEPWLQEGLKFVRKAWLDNPDSRAAASKSKPTDDPDA